jgi:hypothetical protein
MSGASVKSNNEFSAEEITYQEIAELNQRKVTSRTSLVPTFNFFSFSSSSFFLFYGPELICSFTMNETGRAQE